jgi:hypothetical protein
MSEDFDYMKGLHISPDIQLPVEAVTQTFAILAKRRVGKTYTASVMAEEMAKVGLPFVALDPTGAWWGLRASADGKSEGLPVVIIGGAHGDLPLEPTSGKVIAELVVEHPGFYVIDLSETESDEQQDKFATDFAKRLYRLKERHRDPLHLFIDEADSFAPQKPFPRQTVMLGAFEALVRRGGIRGLGMTLITQRPAVLNKNVLTQVEVIIALQTTAPNDQDAVKDWVTRNGTKEQVTQFMSGLASLKQGEAWLWSPAWLEEFKLIHIRQRRTFNSSATPKVGEKRIEPKKLAPVDLEQLKGKIADSIERAKANDPEELKRQIAGLKRELLNAQSAAPPQVEPQVVEVAVISDDQIQRLEEILLRAQVIVSATERLPEMLEELSNLDASFDEGVRRLKEAKAQPRTLRPDAPRITGAEASAAGEQAKTEGARLTRPLGGQLPDGEITRPMQRILDALQSFRVLGLDSVSKSNVAVFSDQSPTSSGYTNNLGRLRSLGLIDYPQGGQVALTPAGLECAGNSLSIASLNDLHRAWFTKLSNPKCRILQNLIRAYPKSVSKQTLAELSGQSATSSGYTNNLGSLRSLGLIDYPQSGYVAATTLLFPDGLD